MPSFYLNEKLYYLKRQKKNTVSTYTFSFSEFLFAITVENNLTLYLLDRLTFTFFLVMFLFLSHSERCFFLQIFEDTFFLLFCN